MRARPSWSRYREHQIPRSTSDLDAVAGHRPCVARCRASRLLPTPVTVRARKRIPCCLRVSGMEPITSKFRSSVSTHTLFTTTNLFCRLVQFHSTKSVPASFNPLFSNRAAGPDERRAGVGNGRGHAAAILRGHTSSFQHQVAVTLRRPWMGFAPAQPSSPVPAGRRRRRRRPTSAGGRRDGTAATAPTQTMGGSHAREGRPDR